MSWFTSFRDWAEDLVPGVTDPDTKRQQQAQADALAKQQQEEEEERKMREAKAQAAQQAQLSNIQATMGGGYNSGSGNRQTFG